MNILDDHTIYYDRAQLLSTLSLRVSSLSNYLGCWRVHVVPVVSCGPPDRYYFAPYQVCALTFLNDHPTEVNQRQSPQLHRKVLTIKHRVQFPYNLSANFFFAIFSWKTLAESFSFKLSGSLACVWYVVAILACGLPSTRNYVSPYYFTCNLSLQVQQSTHHS